MATQLQVVVRRLDAPNEVYAVGGIEEAREMVAEVAQRGYSDLGAIEVERVSVDQVGLIFPGDADASTWLDSARINAPVPASSVKPPMGLTSQRPQVVEPDGLTASTSLTFRIVGRTMGGEQKALTVSARDVNTAVQGFEEDPQCRQIQIYRVVTEHLGVRLPDGREFWNRFLLGPAQQLRAKTHHSMARQVA